MLMVTPVRDSATICRSVVWRHRRSEGGWDTPYSAARLTYADYEQFPVRLRPIAGSAEGSGF